MIDTIDDIIQPLIKVYEVYKPYEDLFQYRTSVIGDLWGAISKVVKKRRGEMVQVKDSQREELVQMVYEWQVSPESEDYLADKFLAWHKKKLIEALDLDDE